MRKWNLGAGYAAVGATPNFFLRQLNDAGTGGDVRLFVSGSGNVGIGTATPSQRLDVAGSIAIAEGARIAPAEYAHAPGHDNTVFFGQFGGSFGGMKVINYYDGSYNNQYLTFETHHGGVSAGERMRIDRDGNVGIGTTVPTDGKLQVNGNISTGSGGIKWKVFSGTTDASASTSFLHGLSENSIISVTGILKTNDGRYVPPEYTNYAPWQYSLLVLGGRIYIQSVDTSMQGQPYKVIVYYQ